MSEPILKAFYVGRQVSSEIPPIAEDVLPKRNLMANSAFNCEFFPMKHAKWFPSATMMAFLAVVALFVSPVLAFGCCCHSAPHSAVSISPQTASHACCDEKKGAQKAENHAHHSQLCAVVTSVCDCDNGSQNRAFTALDSSVFQFSSALEASQNHKFEFAFVADVRRAAYFCADARPRSPDRTSAPGRAPPVFALT